MIAKKDIKFKERDYFGSPASLLKEVNYYTQKAAEIIQFNGGAFAAPEPDGDKVRERKKLK